ncbi:ATP-dependent RNA helicase, partial [Tulasnella sp. 403]
NDIPDLILEMDIVDQLKQRVSLARRLDTAHHKMTKTNHERNWIKNAAKEAEVDLDSDFDRDSDTEIRKSKKDKNAITALKAELNQLLKKPLLARGVSTKFITSGNHPLIEDLMSGSGHAEILGVRGTTAGEATVRRKA